MPVQGGPDVVDERVGLELAHRHVDRHRQPAPERAPTRQLRTRLVENPAADVDDLAAVLEHRDEPVRRHQALGGVVPADQGFDAVDAEVGQVDDGLVEECELAGGQARVELGPEGEPVVGGQLHRRLEDDRLVATGALGPVQRDVCVAQQVLCRGAVADRDPHAGRHREGDGLEPLDVERRSEGLADPVGDGLGTVLQRDSLGQDDEFVAAEASHGVAGADQADEPAGDGLEESVARPVAE